MRRFLLAAAVAALVIGVGFFVLSPRGGGAADVPYRLGSIDRGAITASVRATGTLNPVTTVLVGSQLSGQVVEILADYNSEVKEGQVVARLDATQIRARRDAAEADLTQARADLGMRKAGIDRIRATRVRAEATLRDLAAQRERVVAQLADARRTLERQTELVARSIASQAGYDTARTQAEVQKATLDSVEAQIASQKAELVGLEADIALAEAQAKSAEAAILQKQAKLRDAEIDLARTDIKSPVGGVVVQRNVDLGQTVAASLSAPTLFTIAQDLREIEVWANIDEADVGRLKSGQPVTFSVNAYPARSFEGKVRMVRLGAQTVQNVVTYTGVITVRNDDMALLPGMTANLQVTTDERRDSLRIPNAALRFRPPGAGAIPTARAPAPGAAETPAAGTPSAGRRGGRAIEELRERLDAEVKPTPEQSAAIEKILAESRASFMNRDPGMSEEERREAIRQARRALMERIGAALDPERRQKFQAIASDLRRGGGPAQGDGGTPGRVYVLGDDGAPKPVSVRVGVTDGSHTELLSGGLAEGAAVIVGGGPKAQAAVQETSPAARPRGPRLF
ncbi:MAG TPA: efflux RND transporter periplasmic adaptor subunit [Beijerinckiaceae bacterium]